MRPRNGALSPRRRRVRASLSSSSSRTIRIAAAGDRHDYRQEVVHELRLHPLDGGGVVPGDMVGSAAGTLRQEGGAAITGSGRDEDRDPLSDDAESTLLEQLLVERRHA